MEKWKIAAIAALLLSLGLYGVSQNGDQSPAPTKPVPTGTPLPSPLLGATLPPWNFKTWSTAPIPLASLRGKPALIEIFRTGCSHCQDAVPFMAAIQNRYKPRGLKIVAIQSPGDLTTSTNPENQWADVQSWMKTHGVNYPVAFDQDSKYFQGTLKNQYFDGDTSKLTYPTLMLTDKNGVADFAQTGHDTARAITLGVELEKRFPTSPSLAKNAADLGQWLNQNLPELKAQGALAKALAADLEQRLKGEAPAQNTTPKP